MKDTVLPSDAAQAPSLPFSSFPWDLLFALAEYRTALPIKEYRRYCSYSDNTVYYICPRCDESLDREFQTCCDHCGQMLEWKGYRKAKQRK